MKVQPESFDTKVSTHRILPEEFLTVRELMSLLKIRHRQTIYTLIDQGMPTIRVGKSYRFIKAEAIDFLRENGKKHETSER